MRIIQLQDEMLNGVVDGAGAALSSAIAITTVLPSAVAVLPSAVAVLPSAGGVRGVPGHVRGGGVPPAVGGTGDHDFDDDRKGRRHDRDDD